MQSHFVFEFFSKCKCMMIDNSAAAAAVFFHFLISFHFSFFKDVSLLDSLLNLSSFSLFRFHEFIYLNFFLTRSRLSLARSLTGGICFVSKNTLQLQWLLFCCIALRMTERNKYTIFYWNCNGIIFRFFFTASP